jgi:hypothetical protein
METNSTKNPATQKAELHEQAIVPALNLSVLKRPTTTSPRVGITATINRASVGFLAVLNTYSSCPGIVA